MLKINKKEMVSVIDKVLVTLGDGKIAATKSILFKDCGSKLALITTNLMAFSMILVEKEGEIESFCVDGKMFSDIIKAMDEEEINITKEENIVKIDGDSTHLELSLIDANEFVEFPTVEKEDITEFSMEMNELCKAVEHTEFSASIDEGRPVLKAINFSIEEKDEKQQLTLSATDGSMLSMITVAVKDYTTGDSNNVNVPSDVIKKIVDRNNIKGDCKVKLTKHYMFLELENAKYVIRLIEGKYIDVGSLISSALNKDDLKGVFKVSKSDILSACNLLSIVNQTKKQNVAVLNITADNLNISARDEGKITKDMKIELAAGEKIEETKVALDVNKMQKVLKVIDGDDIIVYTYGEIKPIVIRPASGYAFMFMLLPVRLR